MPSAYGNWQTKIEKRRTELFLYAIELDENCRIEVGKTAHIDYGTMDGHYQGEYEIHDIALSMRMGAADIEVQVAGPGGQTVWLPVSAVEFPN